MGKHSKPKKPENLGKGKVTPVQIAFIVDRYLADNNYTNTLSAFRTEASDLFSKTKGKEAPKGLLGLGEILDEYIRLKEQRVMLDQEKRRVEMALIGIQDVMRTYYSAGGIAVPSSPPLLPPQFVVTPTPPIFPPSGTTHATPPGHMVQGSERTPTTSAAKLPLLLPVSGERNNFSSPDPTSSSAQKRKASKSAPIVPSAPKKLRSQSSKDSFVIRGSKVPSQATFASNAEENSERVSAVSSTSTDHLRIKSPAQVLSVAKSLFKQPPEPGTKFSSPKTPPQAFPSQMDKSISSLCNSSIRTDDINSSQEIALSNCSIMSSETIIVSPLKHTGYYAIQRSYHVTSSPLKSNGKKLSKREHVKGRLDFDESDVSASMAKSVTANSSISSTNGETQETFDFDLSDLDLFNGDFSFSELLVDLDLDCEQIPSESASPPSELNPGSEYQVGSQHMEINQAVPDSCLQTIAGVLTEDSNIQGPDSVTSVKTITKCIVVSPAKTSSFSLGLTSSPAKA